jgi:hypothetical protein
MPEGPDMHDLSRSNIAIQNTPAFAAVRPLAQRLRLDRPAFRAGLRGAARIDLDERATSLCSFVVEHRDQLRPCGVVYVAGQHSTRQTANVDVLDGDPGEAVYEVSGQLVQHVAPSGGNSATVSSEPLPRLVATLRSALAPRKGALAAAQPLGGTLRPIRASDGLAIGQRDERGKSGVETDSLAVAGIGGGDIDVKDDVPLAVLPGKDRGLRIARQGSVPFHLDLAWDADEADAPGLAQGQAVADAELGGVVSGTGAKTRETGFVAALEPGKERLERLVETAEHLLLGAEGPSGEAVMNGACGLQFCGLHPVGDGHTLSPPRLDALLQPGVVEGAEVRKHVSKRGLLGAVRVDAKLVGKYQGAGLASAATDRGQERVAGLQPGGAFAFCTTPQHQLQPKRRAFRCRLPPTVPCAEI